MADEGIWCEDSRRPRALQLFLCLLIAGSCRNDQIRIKHLRGQSDIHVLRIAADCRNKTFRGIDACRPEDLILCRVAYESDYAFIGTPLGTFEAVVNENDFCFTADQFLDNASADAAGAADNVVA